MEYIKKHIGNEKGSAKTSRLYQSILNNSQRLLSLVNQLLDFRKSLRQEMKLKTTYLNIVDLVKANIDAFDSMAKEKLIHTNFSTKEENINGWIDQEKLDVILFNILSNAFRYTPENGFVNISLKVSASNEALPCRHIILEISNSGEGIQKHLQEKVFERFYWASGDESKTDTGSGIGLALTKTMVELHKGKITLQSDPGKMTTFTVYLPINRDSYTEDEIVDFRRDIDRRTYELNKNATLNNEKTLVQENMPNLQKPLIIEDNRELRKFLTSYLSDEFKLLTANNGSDVLSICESENPDLVISDIMMNNMEENKTGDEDCLTKQFERELLIIKVKNNLNNLANHKKEFKNNIQVSSKEPTISRLDEVFLTKVIYLIKKNLDNADFDIDTLCQNLRVSPSQLYRKIKRITGVSPNEFIRTYRLKEAAKMISETSLNISEIAYKVGFIDALYFSKCFKKQFGTPPSKFKMTYVV